MCSSESRKAGIWLAAIMVPSLALAGLADTMWVKQHGVSDGGKFNLAADIATDDSGNVYVCGRGQHDTTNNWNNGMLLVKYNQWGNRLWVRGVDGSDWSQEDIGHALVVDSLGQIFVAGATYNTTTGLDATMAKFTSDGDTAWIRSWNFDNSFDVFFDVALGKSGDLYACGTTVDMPVNLSAFMVMRVNPATGDSLWTRTYIYDTLADDKSKFCEGLDRPLEFFEAYDDWENCATALAVAPNGNVVVTGFCSDTLRDRDWWTMKFNPSGNRLWNQVYYRTTTTYHDDDAAFDVAVANDSQIYCVGFDYYELENSEECYNYAVVRYSSAGTQLNRRTLNVGGVDGDDFAYAVALDNATPQNVYVTGVLEYDATSYDVVTHKFSASLAFLWGSAGALYVSGDDDYGLDITHKNGRVYVTGCRGDDLLVACYTDATADPKDTLWTFTYDSPSHYPDYGNAVCALDSARIYVGGQSDRPPAPFVWSSMFVGRFFQADRDIRADSIIAPSGQVPPNVTVTPEVWVVNEGNAPATFAAYLQIGAAYRDTVYTLTRLLPGDTADLLFDGWLPLAPETLLVRCTVAMTGDNDPTNNFIVDTVIVAFHDVGCSLIVAPVGVVDSGTVVAPQAWLKNYGGVAETFNCRLRIGAWADTVSVTVPPNGSVLRGFDNWTAQTRGTWPVVCSTMHSLDGNPANDKQVDSVTVRVVDMALDRIVVPPDTVDSGTVITPELLVSNRGSEASTPWVHFTMDDGSDALVYSESVQVTIGAGLDSSVILPASLPVSRFGRWRVVGRCRTTGDRHPENDSLAKTMVVKPSGVAWPPGWVEVAPMPTGGGRQVKRGAALAVVEGDTTLVYATKGYKTGEFYAYRHLDNTWQTLAEVPAGSSGRLPEKGGRLASDNQSLLYFTKGNNTLEFLQYSIPADSWTPLTDVPPGPSRKNVKGGTDAVYVVKGAAEYVYLLKGYKSEFFRYDVAGKSWLQLTDAPHGSRDKWAEGSFLVYDGLNTLYAHKAKYHEFWKYDVTADSWSGQQLAGMPLVGMMGRKKKSKDGACGAWFNGLAYCLKGGNTQEFWVYNPTTNSWTESDTMPSVGSTGKKKRVKYGGDIAYAAYAFWALKGNKTFEFWRYGIPLYASRHTPYARDGVSSGVEHSASSTVRISPNPLGSQGVLEYSVSSPTFLSVQIFDAGGRLVACPVPGRPVSGTGNMRFDTRGLASGVYLVKVDAGRASRSLKLVVR